MKLTIFWRLVVGYIAIFFLQMAVSLYVTVQLNHIEALPRSILNTNNQIIDGEKKLADALLLQIRYERKYSIIKDQAVLEYYRGAQNDFGRYFKQLMSITPDARARQQLLEAKRLHNTYAALVDEEMQQVTAGKRYSRERARQKKEQAISEIMASLKKLRTVVEETTSDTIKSVGQASSNARRVALIMTLSSLILGMVISVMVTKGIVRPLSVMKRQTQKIAAGDFSSDLNLTSPPEIRELARAFNYMCARLKEVDKIKSNFFSLMSHELRTPLTSIREGINLLMEKKVSVGEKKLQRLLTIMGEESNRLIELVNSSLDLSKMEAGMMKYRFFPDDLTPLLYKAMSVIESLAEAKKITINSQISEELPTIKMDGERIFQVLNNLLGNAVKFTPAGGQITVRARSVGQGVEVTVSDTGEGIAREDLTAIFDKFQQGSLNNAKHHRGTGLGLSIVKHIVDAHGGKVWAESEPGVGSTFIFVL
jgi:two-component system sensor histidine kinase GlrK